MKLKTIICLAVILACDRFEFPTQAADPISFTKQGDWTETNILLRTIAGGKQLELKGKTDLLAFGSNSGTGSPQFQMVAFIDPETRRVWVGPEQDVYIEADSGIIGGRLMGSSFRWCESAVTRNARSGGLEAIIDEFEKRSFSQNLIAGWVMSHNTQLQPFVNQWFFVAGPSSQQGADAKIKGMAVGDGKLQLDLESPTGLYTASIWFDVETHQVVKVNADGKQVFPESVVEGNTAFALDLYSRLSGTPGNLFFSPYSISTCLAMLYAGAGGDTEKQMAQVFHFNDGGAHVHSAFGDLQRHLDGAAKPNGIQLDIANGLWAQEGKSFLPAFLKIVNEDYQANVKQADFSRFEAVRREINLWVAQKTRDRIQDILPPRSLSADTKLVLANAIYFKGAWAKPFEMTATSTGPFHLATNSQANVPLMSHTDEIRFAENNDFQAVELPYSGDALSMIILLPREIDGVGQLEKQLSPAFLGRLLAQMQKQKVAIFLPKFKMESRFELRDTLVKMGMTDAFSSSADFSGLDGARDLYVTCVFHKAWVEVTDEGTEAAAATVTAMMGSGAPRQPPVFRADHPFIFLIRDRRSGSLLFVGRLSDPRGI